MRRFTGSSPLGQVGRVNHRVVLLVEKVVVVFDVRSRGQVVDETQTLIPALLKCRQVLAWIKSDNLASPMI